MSATERTAFRDLRSLIWCSSTTAGWCQRTFQALEAGAWRFSDRAAWLTVGRAPGAIASTTLAIPPISEPSQEIHAVTIGAAHGANADWHLHGRRRPFSEAVSTTPINASIDCLNETQEQTSGAVALPVIEGGHRARSRLQEVVLTIRAATNPAYYERVEFARDDYYSEAGAASGLWIGREAEALGLRGAPERGDLETLLAGRHPVTSEPLASERFRRTNASFDLTFTAPKSMSVLAAVGEPEVRRAVIAVHEVGVAAGLDYLERNECQARRGAGGLRIITADGFAGAAYTHELSRAGDPHLHTHVVIANLVRGEDGGVSAPDMRPVFAAAKTAGTIAEAAGRAELTRSLGVEWGPVRNGSADIVGVPEAVLDHFSMRRAEIVDLVVARGADGLREVAAIQRETRDHKPMLDREETRADWRARAAEHGLDRTSLSRLLGHERAVELPPQKLARVAERLAGPEGLTRRESTFTRREVIRVYAEAHPQGIGAGRLEALADAFLSERSILVEPARGLRERYTTADLLRTERRLLAIADESDLWMAAEPASVEAALAARPWLGADQAGAVRHLAGGEDRVRLLEARAGRGKTAALSALADAYGADGVPVIGVAWQGEAARTLEAEAGIPAQTAARLLGQIERGREPIPFEAVVVVDEAATMPTRALAALAEAVADREGRLVLVGDRAQLPSIDAGGAFASLADRLGAAELTDNRRQRDPLQIEVADLLGDGRAREALALLEKEGRLRALDSSEDARAQLVGDWARAALPDPASALIMAHDRADVAALNAAARAEMERAGLLGEERLLAHGREWAAGDRLVCRRNDYRPEIDVRNGTRGTVEEVDRQRGALVVRADDGRRVTLPSDYLEHGHHGYAITGHASQGATVDHTFLLASPEPRSGEWGYVVGSRHRIDLQVYLSADDPAEARATLARAWRRSQAKGLALDRLERAGAIAREPSLPRGLDERSTAELWAERSAAAARLRTEGPPGPLPELGRLETDRARAESDLREAGWRADRATERLADMTPWARLTRAGRAEARDLETIAAQSERSADLARVRLSALADAIEGARDRLPARDEWERGPAAALARQIDLLDAEVERRVDARARAAERETPAYLERELGRPPDSQLDRAPWRAAARAIEGYRERYGVTDERLALGREPRGLDQLLARQEAGREVGREIVRRHGLDRGIDL